VVYNKKILHGSEHNRTENIIKNGDRIENICTEEEIEGWEHTQEVRHGREHGAGERWQGTQAGTGNKLLYVGEARQVR
jgi:hypothetical protein